MLEKLLGANTKTRLAAIVFAASIAVTNFPWLLNWLPEDLRNNVLSTAYYAIQTTVALALFWVKQSNVSGLGTMEQPYVKPDTTTVTGNRPVE